MREIELSTQFRRDYKREKKGQHRSKLDFFLCPILDLLSADTPLHEKNKDHAMTGKWNDCRNCHIKPDLILLYQKPDTNTLRLVRLGSHSELDI